MHSTARAAAPRLVAATLLAACASGGTTAATPPSQPVRMLPADSAPMPPASGLSAAFHAAFDSADTRARAVLFWQQCESTVIRLRAGGTFGAAASAPRTVHCERTADGVPLGAVFDADTGLTRVRRMVTIRLDGTRPRHTAPLDTARMLAASKLARDVSRLVTPAWRRLGRPFTVVPVTEWHRVEAWVMPLSPRGGATAVTGGDAGYARGANGAPSRIVDRAASWKLVTIPAGGDVALASAEGGVAALPELALARGLAERGRPVSVRTGTAVSTLVQGVDARTGARVRWEHAPAR